MVADADDRAQRAAEVVGAWQLRRDGGAAEPPSEVIARHPDLAPELREAFDALAVLDGAFAPASGGEDAPAASRAAPLRIGDYEIVREIGRGGMGVVYEAVQSSMRRPVALKVLFPSVTVSPKAIERFRREAWAAGRLHHTNVVQVHTMGSEDGQWYYAMELVRGRALEQILADVRRLRGSAREDTPSTTSHALGLSTGSGRREEYASIARMFAGVAEALAAAHDAGVVHRDVKPSNLMLDDAGTLKILDFGLASVQEEPGTLTATGALLGTPAYMSPEQARAWPVDGRTDVYSLGATLYEVLTLHPVARGRDLAQTMRQILTKDPVAPRRIEPRVPRDLETIVLKALEKAPGRRYAKAADLADDLRAFADGRTIGARRVGWIGRAWRLARRHPGRTAVGAALTVSVVVAAWLALLHGEEAGRREDRDYEALLVRAQQAELRPGTEPGHEFSDDLLAQAVARRPDRPEAHWLRALMMLGPTEKRLADLDRAAALGVPARSIAWARAHVLHEGGRPVDARAAEREAEALPGPRGPDDAYLEGHAALRRGDLDAARARFEETVRTQPAHGALRRRAFAELSVVHERLGAYDDALEALSKAWDVDSMPMFAALRAATLWRRVGRPEEAERRFAGYLAQMSAEDPVDEWRRGGATLFTSFGWDWLLRFAEAGLAHHAGDPVLVGYRVYALTYVGRSADAVAEARAAVDAGTDHEMLWIAYAKALRNAGQLADAVRVGRRAVRAYPARMQPRVDLAIAFHQLGRFEDGLRVLDEALQTLPEDGPAQYWRGKLLLRLGKADEAITTLRRAATLRPADPEYGRTLADALAGAGRPAERLEVVEAWSKRFPLEWTFTLTRAATLQDLGRAEEAKEILEAGVALADRELAVHPLRGPLHELKVTMLAALGRDDEALAAAKAGVQAAPESSDLWVEKGVIETKKRSFDEAERSFRKAIELQRDDPHPMVNLLPVLLQTGRSQEALDLSEKALLLPMSEIERVTGAYNRACALRRLGRTKEAVEAFEVVLRDAPSYGDAAVALAEIRLEAGDMDGAHAALDRVRGIPPTAAMRATRGRLFAEAGRMEDALGETAKAAELDPTNRDHRYNVALMLALLRRHAEAAVAYDRFLELAPDDLDGRIGKAEALLHSGRPADAKGVVDAVLAKDPTIAVAHAVAGAVAKRLDEWEVALAHMEEAARLAPDRADLANNAAWNLVDCPRQDLCDPAKAVVHAERATRLRPGEASIWNTLGFARLRKGDLEAAVDALRRSAALDQGADPSTGWFLATALARQGKAEEARAALAAPERWWEAHPEGREEMARYRREAMEAAGAPPPADESPR